jgi:pyrroloquinoline quinone (PQQ) biosynthesis protein C
VLGVSKHRHREQIGSHGGSVGGNAVVDGNDGICSSGGEDEWALRDLEVLGVERSTALAHVPSPNVARLVGAQYYWVLHVDPIAVLGYLAALERDPPSSDFIEELIRRTGHDRAAFRTLIAHAERDPEHADELDELLDHIELTGTQWELVSLSALSTVQMLARVLRELVGASR